MPERFIVAYLLIALMIVAAGVAALFLHRQRREKRRVMRGGRAKPDRLGRRVG